MEPRVLALSWALTVIACGGPPPRVQLEPVPLAGSCGVPAGATELRVIAYSGGGEVVRAVPLDGALDIADFPADTEQLGVEVVVGGGTVGAAGKTAPFEFAALEDGATLRVLMAPPGGLCAVGAPIAARTAPLIARTSDGVLVVGGVDGGGQPIASAERYDPLTGTFTAVALPEVLADGGFVGAALAELPDGRVVLSGGPRAAITIYDPATHTFGDSVLVESRAFHTAIAIDATHVLLAGGCSAVVAGACDGVARKSSRRYVVDDPGTAETGPTLVAGRLGARILATGIQRDGEPAFVIAGGVPAPDATDATAADRLTLARDAVAVAGTHGEATLLDGGAVLTSGNGVASVIVPVTEAGGAPSPTAVAIAGAPALSGIRLATGEDGRVVGFGAITGELVMFDPMRERWEVAPPAAGSDAVTVGPDPALVRLADGSVLVVGSGGAAVYRPALVGPSSGSITVVPVADNGASVLTPLDPRAVDRATDWSLQGTSALVGGPRAASGSVRAIVRVRAGGVALIARHRGTGDAVVAELVPGSPARLVQLVGAETRVLCTGAPVEPFEPATGVSLELVIDGASARVTRDGAAAVACDVGAGARGAWGLGSLGPGGDLAVDTVTVARGP